MAPTSRRTARLDDDRGVSPIISTIMMVAIAVVLAASAFFWFSTLAGNDPEASERANIRATGHDAGGDGLDDYIRLTLIHGENAPYAIQGLSINLTDPDGDVLAHNPGTATANDEILCRDISSSPGAGGYDAECDSDPFDGADRWERGATLYIPCQKAGNHVVTVTLLGHVVFDDVVNCDQAAQA